jgi:hypothetical protein
MHHQKEIPKGSPLTTCSKLLCSWRTRGRLNVHIPSSMVLVINDNLYGLMFSLSLLWRNHLLRMFEDHVLDSRLDYINIKIYFEYWHQDNRFEEMNMIWSIELELFFGTQSKPALGLKILRVWLQVKNSSDGSMSRSWWSGELSHGWPRLRACNQMKNTLCISIDIR